MAKKDSKVLNLVPGAKDDSTAEMLKALKDLAAIAPEIASTKRALYTAYVAVGFKRDEALELCKSITI